MKTLLILLLAAALGSAQEIPYPAARDLIARVQNHLKQAADFGSHGDVKKVKRDEKEIDRYRHAQRSASDFDRHLSKGKFDKGELNSLVGDLKNILDHNTLESQERDQLTDDIRDLRNFRAQD
jgi:hypothetical protein